MDVKEAVKLAKQQVREIFAEEALMNIGLEEVVFNEEDNTWAVTIGFSRPWDEPRSSLAAISGGMYPHRSYKVICISDIYAKVISVTDRESRTVNREAEA